MRSEVKKFRKGGSQQKGNNRAAGARASARLEPSRPLRPLSFAVFIGNKPMTEADSIIHDPNVAVDFTCQIFPPEIQQSMIEWSDYEVFRDRVHGSIKELYCANETGMRLQAAQKEIVQKDGLIQDLERRAEKAESEIRKARAVEKMSVWLANMVVTDRVNQHLIDHAIAHRDTATIFSKEAI